MHHIQTVLEMRVRQTQSRAAAAGRECGPAASSERSDMMVGFDFQKSEELKYNHSQHDVGGELKKRRKNNENMQRRCTLILIWVII